MFSKYYTMPYKKTYKRPYRPKRKTGVIKKIKKDLNVLKTEMKASSSWNLRTTNISIATVVGTVANTTVGWDYATNFTAQAPTYLPIAPPGTTTNGYRIGSSVRFNTFDIAYEYAISPSVFDASKQGPYSPMIRVIVLLVKQQPVHAGSGSNNFDMCDLFALTPPYTSKMIDDDFLATRNPDNRKNFRFLYDRTHSIAVNGAYSTPTTMVHKKRIRMPKGLITTYLDNTATVTSASQNHVYVLAYSNLQAAAQALYPVGFTINTVTFYEQ